MLGTVRTFTSEVRDRVMKRFEEIVIGLAKVMECEAKIEYHTTTAAVLNDAAMSAEVRELAKAMPGVTTVTDSERTMGSGRYGVHDADSAGLLFLHRFC